MLCVAARIALGVNICNLEADHMIRLTLLLLLSVRQQYQWQILCLDGATSGTSKMLFLPISKDFCQISRKLPK